MNRERKFRVWDNVSYMSNPFTLMELQSKKIEFTSYCTVMQYTGLKDLNGVEIYEGDILERIGTKDNFTQVVMDTRSRELVVVELKVSQGEFGDYSFGFSMATQRTYSERSNPATYTVIGNIHEHSHLLNQTA